MKGFEKFLFFYSIIAITAIFFTSAFFLRTPQNVISGFLTLPLVIYFWLRLTSADTVNVSRWSLRFLTIIIVLTALGTFTYFLSAQSTILTNKKDIELNQKLSDLSEKIASLSALQTDKQITTELSNIQNDLSNIKGNQPSPSDTSMADLFIQLDNNYAGKIQLKDNVIDPVDVYEKASLSSSKVGTLIKGFSYPFLTKENNWYKVVYEKDKTGFINSVYVKEVN